MSPLPRHNCYFSMARRPNQQSFAELFNVFSARIFLLKGRVLVFGDLRLALNAKATV